MSREWPAEIGAVFGKELRGELRARAGLVAATLFGVCTVSAISLASYGRTLEGQEGVAASLLWTALIFSSVVALPRAFVAEEGGARRTSCASWRGPTRCSGGKRCSTSCSWG